MTEKADHGPPAGTAARRLQPYFVAVCISARRGAGKRITAVADHAGLSEKSIDRFEKGETWTTDNLERIAAAYAHVGNIGDGRALFQRAIKQWTKHGLRPLTIDEEQEISGDTERPIRDLIEEIRLAGERERARAGSEERPTSTRRRRATGG